MLDHTVLFSDEWFAKFNSFGNASHYLIYIILNLSALFMETICHDGWYHMRLTMHLRCLEHEGKSLSLYPTNVMKWSYVAADVDISHEVYTNYNGEMNHLCMVERIRRLKIFTRVYNIQSCTYKTFIFPCNLNRIRH